MSKIVTERVNPPVPTRQWDWVAYIKGDKEANGPTGRGPTEAEALRDLCEQLVTLALKAQPEPAQEPFGYLWPTGRHPEFRFTQQKRDGVDGMPLYTAPPQRKPLPIHDQHCVDVPGYGLMARRLVRAVERAHGIGGPAQPSPATLFDPRGSLGEPIV